MVFACFRVGFVCGVCLRSFVVFVFVSGVVSD